MRSVQRRRDTTGKESKIHSTATRVWNFPGNKKQKCASFQLLQKKKRQTDRLKLCPTPYYLPSLVLAVPFALFSLRLLVRVGRLVVPRQRHVGVPVPQFVELGHFGVAAAGAAVPEAGQWGAHLHALHSHRTLDGLTQLQREKSSHGLAARCYKHCGKHVRKLTNPGRVCLSKQEKKTFLLEIHVIINDYFWKSKNNLRNYSHIFCFVFYFILFWTKERRI